MTLGYYKRLVRNCLRKAVKTEDRDYEDYVNKMMKEYEDEFPGFLEKNFSPEVAATAILMGF